MDGDITRNCLELSEKLMGFKYRGPFSIAKMFGNPGEEWVRPVYLHHVNW